MSATLTPTEELIMEVLAARHRLHEPFWTFSARPAITRAAQSLQAKGLVALLSPQVERTFRAELTEAGQAEVLDKNYLSPAEKRWLSADSKKVLAKLEEIFG